MLWGGCFIGRLDRIVKESENGGFLGLRSDCLLKDFFCCGLNMQGFFLHFGCAV